MAGEDDFKIKGAAAEHAEVGLQLARISHGFTSSHWTSIWIGLRQPRPAISTGILKDPSRISARVRAMSRPLHGRGLHVICIYTAINNHADG
jgi:hypothetical protein